MLVFKCTITCTITLAKAWLRSLINEFKTTPGSSFRASLSFSWKVINRDRETSVSDSTLVANIMGGAGEGDEATSNAWSIHQTARLLVFFACPRSVLASARAHIRPTRFSAPRVAILSKGYRARPAKSAPLASPCCGCHAEWPDRGGQSVLSHHGEA